MKHRRFDNCMTFTGQPFTARLPAELRMRIYREALRSGSSLVYEAYHPSPHHRLCSPPRPYAGLDNSLLAVNRAVYGEAIDALYDVNIIRFSSYTVLFYALDLPQNQNIRLVRRLDILA